MTSTSVFGGLDLSMDLPDITGKTLYINIGNLSATVAINTTYVGFYSADAFDGGGTIIATKLVEKYSLTAAITHLRVFIHDDFISVYNDIHCIGSCCPTPPKCLVNTPVKLKATSPITVTNIRIRELGTYREAVWVDMESTGANAISSVIQERPVLLFPRHNGAVAYTYLGNLGSSNLYRVRNHRKETRFTPGMSDITAYYAYSKLVQSTSWASDVGFTPAVLRLPNINTDVDFITQIIQQRALEGLTLYTANARLHHLIEIGDKVNLSYVLSGTGTTVSEYFIAENLSFNWRPTQESETLQGRHVT